MKVCRSIGLFLFFLFFMMCSLSSLAKTDFPSATHTQSSGQAADLADMQRVSSNPAAVSVMTGTGQLGKILGINENTGIRLGGLWLINGGITSQHNSFCSLYFHTRGSNTLAS